MSDKKLKRPLNQNNNIYQNNGSAMFQHTINGFDPMLRYNHPTANLINRSQPYRSVAQFIHPDSIAQFTAIPQQVGPPYVIYPINQKIVLNNPHGYPYKPQDISHLYSGIPMNSNSNEIMSPSISINSSAEPTKANHHHLIPYGSTEQNMYDPNNNLTITSATTATISGIALSANNYNLPIYQNPTDYYAHHQHHHHSLPLQHQPQHMMNEKGGGGYLLTTNNLLYPLSGAAPPKGAQLTNHLSGVGIMNDAITSQHTSLPMNMPSSLSSNQQNSTLFIPMSSNTTANYKSSASLPPGGGVPASPTVATSSHQTIALQQHSQQLQQPKKSSAITIVNPATGDSYTPQDLAKDVSDRSSVNEFRNKVTCKAFAPDDEEEEMAATAAAHEITRAADEAEEEEGLAKRRKMISGGGKPENVAVVSSATPLSADHVKAVIPAAPVVEKSIPITVTSVPSPPLPPVPRADEFVVPVNEAAPSISIEKGLLPSRETHRDEVNEPVVPKSIKEDTIDEPSVPVVEEEKQTTPYFKQHQLQQQPFDNDKVNRVAVVESERIIVQTAPINVVQAEMSVERPRIQDETSIIYSTISSDDNKTPKILPPPPPSTIQPERPQTLIVAPPKQLNEDNIPITTIPTPLSAAPPLYSAGGGGVGGKKAYSIGELLQLGKLVDPDHYPTVLASYHCFKQYGGGAIKRFPASGGAAMMGGGPGGAPPSNLYDYRYANNYFRGGPPPNQNNLFPQPPPRDYMLARHAYLAASPSPTIIELPTSENAWKSLGKMKADMDPEQYETQQLVCKVKAILNKMAPNNFTSLINDFRALHPLINNVERATEVIAVIFNKGLMEPLYADGYANFVKCMHQMVNVYKPTAILLNMSQKEFYHETNQDMIARDEEWNKNIEDAKDDEQRKLLEEDYQEYKLKLRDRYLGNIKFLSELYKIGLISERILNECLNNLLKAQTDLAYEGLCNFLRFVGKYVEIANQSGPLNHVVDQLVPLSTDKSLPSRIRYMMIDIIELRQNKWVPRHDEDVPKTFEQIAQDMARENEENKKMAAAQKRNVNKRPGGFGGGGGNASTTPDQQSFFSKKFDSPSISPSFPSSSSGPGGLGGNQGASFDKNLAQRPFSNVQRSEIPTNMENIKLAPASKWRNKPPAVATGGNNTTLLPGGGGPTYSRITDSARQQTSNATSNRYNKTPSFNEPPRLLTKPPQHSNSIAPPRPLLPAPIPIIKNRFALETEDDGDELEPEEIEGDEAELTIPIINGDATIVGGISKLTIGTDTGSKFADASAVPQQLSPSFSVGPAALEMTTTTHKKKGVEERFVSYLKDFFNTEAEEPFVEACLDLSPPPITPGQFASPSVLAYVFDQTNTVRVKYPHALVTILSAYSKSNDKFCLLVSDRGDDISSIFRALSDYLKNIEDLVEDYPKIFNYLAEIVVPLVIYRYGGGPNSPPLPPESISEEVLSDTLDQYLHVLLTPLENHNQGRYVWKLLIAILGAIHDYHNTTTRFLVTPLPSDLPLLPRVLVILRKVLLEHTSGHLCERVKQASAREISSGDDGRHDRTLSHMVTTYFTALNESASFIFDNCLQHQQPANHLHDEYHHSLTDTFSLNHLDQFLNRLNDSDRVDFAVKHIQQHLSSTTVEDDPKSPHPTPRSRHFPTLQSLLEKSNVTLRSRFKIETLPSSSSS